MRSFNGDCLAATLTVELMTGNQRLVANSAWGKSLASKTQNAPSY